MSGFDPSIPIERAWMPPKAWYLDAEHHKNEAPTVFWRTWQPVALVDDFATTGDYRAGCTAGMPWVVVRDSNGDLRAFHNACRHKGREVVTGAGRADTLVCSYHAWSYGLDGRLQKAPRMAGIEDFDRKTMSLPPMACEIWGPWVFINGDVDAPALAASIPEISHAFQERGFDDLTLRGRREWSIGCNWKVYIDNYLDGGYHIPHMHPSLDQQIDMSTYETKTYASSSLQSTPPNKTDAAILDDRIGGGALYAWLFPNLMLNRYGPCLDTNYVLPDGPARCVVRYEFWFDTSVDDEFVEASIKQADITQVEDIEICESVQRGLGSPSYQRGRYAPQVETGEWHFHSLLAHAYEREPS